MTMNSIHKHDLNSVEGITESHTILTEDSFGPQSAQ